MNAVEKKISLLLNALSSRGLLNYIGSVHHFFDEPKLHQYSCQLQYPKMLSDGIYNREINAAGLSIDTKEESVLKCLGESIERLCLFCFKSKQLLPSRVQGFDINGYDLDTHLNIAKHTLGGTKFKCVRGYELKDDRPCLIPAQLVYLNYHSRAEPWLSNDNPISTGAAGGFTHEETLLRGILEIVERDAFMTMYLNKIPVQKVSLGTITSPSVKKLIYMYGRYNLIVHVFNMSNNIIVPSYLTILEDHTGLGPPISLGMKADLDSDRAVLGSLEEAFLTRSWVRKKIIDKTLTKADLEDSSIKTLLDRAQFWLSKNKVAKINFLLKNKPSKYNKSTLLHSSLERLKSISNQLLIKGHRVWYVDITLDMFKSAGYRVYKVIIPSLQPLYLNESSKQLRLKRLKEISLYFNQKKFSINDYPHPFL